MISEEFIKISGTILGLLFLILIILIMQHLKKYYAHIFKIRSKSFIGIFFSFQNATIFWKELVKPTFTKDLVYMIYINLLRIILVIFVVIGLTWLFA